MKKIKETKKRVTAAILAAALALSLTACGNGGNAASSNDANSGSSAENTANEAAGSQENGDDAGSDAPAEENKERVTLKYATFRVGAHVMAPSEAEILRLAKEKFKDEFDIEVEEIPSDSTYIDKMKVLAASNDLPDIIEGKSGLFEIALQGNLAVPLTKYFEEDPEWRAAIGEANIAFNTRDGEIWSAGLSGDSAVGYYYNKELFAKAGIEPAKTWDEFFSNCDKLKEAGITPLSLATGEVAYSSNLFLAAAIGTSSPEGYEFMTSLSKHNDFNRPEVIKGIEIVKRLLQEYTTQDAVGAVYANISNNFYMEKTAMIPNGPWMIPDFSNPEKAPEGFYDKVGVALFPNNGMVVGSDYGALVTAKGSDAQIEAAVKFLKFLSGEEAQKIRLEMGSVPPLSPNVTPSPEFIESNPLFADLLALQGEAEYKCYDMSFVSPSNFSSEWKTLYPELVYDRITPEEFALKLNDIAARSHE